VMSVSVSVCLSVRENISGNACPDEFDFGCLPYCVSGSTLTAVGRSQLLARWPGTHSRISPGIYRAAQTVLGVYLKRTCLRVTSASSALGLLNDYALYKSTHALTHSLKKSDEWRAIMYSRVHGTTERRRQTMKRKAVNDI